jgi:hypothetical protein
MIWSITSARYRLLFMMSLHRMDVFADALSYMGGSGHKASRCLAGCPPDIKGNAVCHVGG